MKKKKKFYIYIYMFLLFAYSGNPFFIIGESLWQYVFAVFVLLLALWHKSFFDLEKRLFFYRYLLFFLLLFFFQKLVLGYISIPGILNFIIKISFGYIVISYVGKHFKYAYFKVLYFISIVSLIGYCFNFFGFDIPSFDTKNEQIKSLIIFTQNADGLRNSGMFWEPGAFACYIILGFLMYLGSIKDLLEQHRLKVIILILALVTTYSTTGYMVLFLISILTIYFEYKNKYGVFILPVLLIFSLLIFYVYENTDFMKEKIEKQYEGAFDRRKGEYAPDRIGAFLFDLHYIQKHPLVGNGLHSKTRYSDHPFLENESGHGNGFSNFLASMGILSFLFYSFYILKYNQNHPWVFLLGIVLLLQGEQLLNYPLFLCLPFIFIYEKKYSRIIDMSQS